MDIPIIFEDNHLLVVEKPPNILSQEDKSKDLDILTLLKNKIKVRDNKPGNVFLGLVHRLDRPVGGVMIFAKTSKCASRLTEQIRKRTFEKFYLAIIHGIPKKKTGILENFLLKNRRTNTVSVVEKNKKGARKAILDYEVIDTVENYSLIKINLRTGRPHQIRVQLSVIGHPLYGDQRYGYEINKKGQQIALWSHIITCRHPILKEKISFTSFPKNQGIWKTFKLERFGQIFTTINEDWSLEQKNALDDKILQIRE